MILLQDDASLKLGMEPVLSQISTVNIAGDIAQNLTGTVTRNLSESLSSIANKPVKKVVSWAAVSGADRLEVVSGQVTFGASDHERNLTGMSVSKDGEHHVIALGRDVQLSSLSLKEMSYLPTGAAEFETYSPSANARFVVSIPNDQTTWLPLYTHPTVKTGSIPKQYAGVSTSLRSGRMTIRFPIDMPIVNKLRISIMQDFPGEGERVLRSSFEEDGIRIADLPLNLKFSDVTNGLILNHTPNLFLRALPDIRFDLRNPIKDTFNRQLSNDEQLRFEYQLQADNQSKFRYWSTPVKGELIRHFSGTSKVTLEGLPQLLELDLSAGDLDSEPPSSVDASLTLQYKGLRVLARHDDPVPDVVGGLSGMIVEADAVETRISDPELDHYPIDRIGVIGRAPQGCELSLTLTPQHTLGTTNIDSQPEYESSESADVALEPGVTQVEASQDMQLIWISIPNAIRHKGKFSLSLRANGGRFFWVKNADAKPALKVVVRDPDPANRPVHINNRLLTQLTQVSYHLPRTAIAPSLFSRALPILSSRLFVTLELGDLTLRYAR